MNRIFIFSIIEEQKHLFFLMKKTNISHENSDLISILNTHFEGKLNMEEKQLTFLNMGWHI